ncbi:hypothetical protein FAIPA1_10202 [Frankia sp. AiPs1]
MGRDGPHPSDKWRQVLVCGTAFVPPLPSAAGLAAGSDRQTCEPAIGRLEHLPLVE